MKTNIIRFPGAARNPAANDRGPSGPGGSVASIALLRRRLRIVRTLRGVILGRGTPGSAVAA